MKNTLTIYFAFLLVTQALAQTTFIVDGLTYTITDGNNVSVAKSSTKLNNALEIPSTVTNNGITYNVTSIPNRAFSDCEEITSIVVPSSVTAIGNGAFYGCSSLQSISLPFVGDKPHTTTDIYQYPLGYIFGDIKFNGGSETTQFYYGNYSNAVVSRKYYIPTTLKEINITGSSYIPYGAFYNCSELISVTIPNSVTKIGDQVFRGCTKLIGINVESTNTKYTSVDGVLFNKKMTTIICYPNGKTETTFTIPNSVTKIGNYAFNACNNLTSITISNSVTSIDEGAFECCISLESVTIPNNVTSIGYAAFYGCSNLIYITIPISVKYIDGYAFSQCNKATLYFEYKGSTIEWSSAWNTYYYGTIKWGCLVIRTKTENGTIATECEYYAVKGDDGSVWYLAETTDETITLTASPNKGYHFVKWTCDEEDITANPITLDVTASKTYTAVFETDVPTLVNEPEENQVVIYAIGQNIIVENANADIYTYDIAGRPIAHQTPQIQNVITVGNNGVYIVRIGNMTKKVVVK